MSRTRNHLRHRVSLVLGLGLITLLALPAPTTLPPRNDERGMMNGVIGHTSLVLGPLQRTKDRSSFSLRVSGAYGKLPLSFEANQGQIDDQVKFLSRGSGYSLFLTSTEAVLELRIADCRLRIG